MSESLVRHQPFSASSRQAWFYLKPDLVMSSATSVSVMDTKWKLIDQKKDSRDDKYDLSQSDFYQLAAYGEKYQRGAGHMLLIYPAYDSFTRPLPEFLLNDNLTLWVVPFDLEQQRLVSGEWSAHLPQLAEACVAPEEPSSGPSGAHAA